MVQGGYILALDVGDRRIGVAVASLIARLPAPHGVIDRNDTADAPAAVAGLVRELGAEVVVVGLPRSQGGEESAQTQAARGFAAQLEKLLAVPVVMQDESVTSIEAEKRLQARGKPYDKGDIDAEAAAMILDDYLALQARSTA